MKRPKKCLNPPLPGFWGGKGRGGKFLGRGGKKIGAGFSGFFLVGGETNRSFFRFSRQGGGCRGQYGPPFGRVFFFFFFPCNRPDPTNGDFSPTSGGRLGGKKKGRGGEKGGKVPFFPAPRSNRAKRA